MVCCWVGEDPNGTLSRQRKVVCVDLLRSKKVIGGGMLKIDCIG